jgi:hypothetical protein
VQAKEPERHKGGTDSIEKPRKFSILEAANSFGQREHFLLGDRDSTEHQTQQTNTIQIEPIASHWSVSIDLQTKGICKSMEILEIMMIVGFSLCALSGSIYACKQRRNSPMKASPSTENLASLGEPENP